MVARGGVEPPTFHFSGGRSYQLSYLAAVDPGRPGHVAELYRIGFTAQKPVTGDAFSHAAS